MDMEPYLQETDQSPHQRSIVMDPDVKLKPGMVVRQGATGHKRTKSMNLHGRRASKLTVIQTNQGDDEPYDYPSNNVTPKGVNMYDDQPKK